jgi:hypothetical protein
MGKNILKSSPLKPVSQYSKHVIDGPKLLFKSHTAIGFYVKTMSAHGSHLGWRSWLPDTILKVYYPRTIDDMFAILAYWSLKPVSQFKANMVWMVLKWSIFKIVSSDPVLHPRWPPSADIL